MTINQAAHDRIHYTASAGDGETQNSFSAAHHLAYITFFHVMMFPRNSDQVRLQDTPEKITQSIPRGPQAMNDGKDHDGNL